MATEKTQESCQKSQGDHANGVTFTGSHAGWRDSSMEQAMKRDRAGDRAAWICAWRLMPFSAWLWVASGGGCCRVTFSRVHLLQAVARRWRLAQVAQHAQGARSSSSRAALASNGWQYR